MIQFVSIFVALVLAIVLIVSWLVYNFIKNGFHIHIWREIFPASKPDRQDWSCWLRHCRCGKVEYKAFATFGDKKWHDLSDHTGTMWASEHEGIIQSAKHHKLLPECRVVVIVDNKQNR